MANVYCRFVTNFSGMAKPLNAMLKKNARPTWDDPKLEAVEALETIKRKLISPPILALPKKDRPCRIDSDASSYQLGATLLQQQNSANPKAWVPVGYWSKTLNSAEQNYSATERECYSIVWAVLTLRPYIEVQKLVLRTDHDALQWLLTLYDPSGRLMRWRLGLSEFDFEIQYRPGRVNQVTDALSPLLTPGGSDDRPVDDDIPTFGDDDVLAVMRASRRSLTTNDTDTKEGHPTTGEPASQLAKRYSHHDEEVMDDVLDDALDLFDMGIAEQTYEPIDVVSADVPTTWNLQRCETDLAAWVPEYPQGGVQRLRYLRGAGSPRLGLLSRERSQGCVSGAG